LKARPPSFSQQKEDKMKRHCACLAVAILLLVTTAHAEWNGIKGPNSTWYEAQQINPEAQIRLGVSWKSCCNHSDVVKTHFRVDRATAEDQWWWLDVNTWRLVPPDIIHWNDPTPDGQPILFAYMGTPTCFYPGDTGG
jgi:hypothetical protein